eukprot:TRINITY_DN1315_c0_g1_i2.p1 TRINITY_DN1315_c0_g1~~TRINITY_DN1315_c0_g1_i2.p1  ORF type:complete len:213 (+),score=7.18 TRINITY_DN1315_c0_g1_i2:434-1072(+)
MHSFLRSRKAANDANVKDRAPVVEKPKKRFFLSRKIFTPNPTKSQISQNSSKTATRSMSSSSTTSRKELEEVFRKFDANKDGKVSRDEIRKVMAALGQETSDSTLDKLMKETDTDGDGLIDFEEFLKGTGSRGSSANSRHTMKDVEGAFNLYDLDKNGSISADELHRVFANLGEPASVEECRKMIRGADTNLDGSVDLSEFKSMMMSKPRRK